MTMMNRQTCHMLLLLLATFAIHSASTEITDNPMAIFVFNATLPMMQFAIDGTDFHTQFLQMNSKELEESRQEALDYFRQTFGISYERNGRDVAIRNYETNPLANMRCIYLSGTEYMPADGLVVRDGGWMLTIINPNGIGLAGRYDGTHVPFGTTFSVGHWVTQLINESGEITRQIVWKNRHVAPGGIAAYNEGSRSFHGVMAVTSDDWGEGESLHVATYTINKQGMATAQLRNFITFQNF